ncbi:hypothetical protein BH10CYA1_BH10CYA1_01870 [soil metagenome]
MNWKILLPVSAMLVTLMPTGAFARNHSILDGLSPSSSMSTSPLLGGGTSLLGSHGNSLTGGLTNGLNSTASPVANTLTSGLTNHGLLNTNSGLLGNSGLLNGNGLLNKHKHKRSWLSRLLSGNFLGLGRFQNGSFNNNGSLFGNSNSGIFRRLLGNRNF